MLLTAMVLRFSMLAGCCKFPGLFASTDLRFTHIRYGDNLNRRRLLLLYLKKSFPEFRNGWVFLTYAKPIVGEGDTI